LHYFSSDRLYILIRLMQKKTCLFARIIPA
jgi:hypothetical protein